MTDQQQLPFAHDRPHDLPPVWDDDRVEWHGWHAQPSPVFICPPRNARPEPCPACGSMRERVMNCGTCWHVRRLQGPLARRLGADQGRTVVGATLMAWRCLDCGHDQVHDMTADQWWDLDPLDYLDAGSVTPPE